MFAHLFDFRYFFQHVHAVDAACVAAHVLALNSVASRHQPFVDVADARVNGFHSACRAAVSVIPVKFVEQTIRSDAVLSRFPYDVDQCLRRRLELYPRIERRRQRLPA